MFHYDYAYQMVGFAIPPKYFAIPTGSPFGKIRPEKQTLSADSLDISYLNEIPCNSTFAVLE
jgi:hypothetical protein